ncbi:hypothetical protein H1R16_05390 [Marnyiella aurantia]|uniref:GerMN domain-containing protein n=1 Tax=Marnyiella aurantia TaxID=2758037 RepID=A0A7D7LR43_9FLAO|nr:DUF6702 family protein [Marnyiella aurantia]MBA5247692.1 hypothetical protein [Marnyiella aurantia]QMS99440.1 hypothetical protein H1R16_05390 [Marnyiella aurantia]
MRKLLILFSVLLFSALTAGTVHPYHVGSVEFRYNSEFKTFQISAKFFLDDLENALKEKYGKAVHFNDEKFKAQINSLLVDYLSDYLKLKADHKVLTLTYLGYEEDSESVNIYLESEKINTPKKVEAAVSALYNLFDDQINIIHIVVEGKRHSHKLSYPDRYLFKEF